MLKGYVNKFNRGEVSPEVLTRDDIARIRDCAELMQNFMPIRLGPMVYRPGTEHIGPVKAQTYHRVLPFIASADDMAILEISQTNAASQETLRVWVDDELVTRSACSATITNGTFATDLTGWTDASTGFGATAWATGSGVNITGDAAGGWGILYQTITVTAGQETPLRIVVEDAPITLGIGSAGANTGDIFTGYLRPGQHSLVFTTGVTSVTLTVLNDRSYPAKLKSLTIESAGTMEITMSMFPMTDDTAVIPSLRYEQSADVMFIASNGYTLAGTTEAPYVRVERRGRKSWSVVPVQLTDGPFGSVNTTFISLTPGATSGVTTLTSNINFFFAGGSEGRLYRLDHAGTQGVCRVLSVTSNTVVQVQVLTDFGATTATFDWYEGRFAPNLPAPTALTLSEGRLWLGGADRIYGSVSDAYDSFDETLVGDSAAIQRSLGFGPVQQVAWLSEGDVLTAGLAIGEAAIRSSALSEVLSPTNVNVKGMSTQGCAEVGPVNVDSVTYFVQRALKKILGLSGGGSGAPFTIDDTTVLHPDICQEGITRIVVTRQPETRIFAVLTTGEVRVYLIDRVEQVTAWSRLVIAGDAVVTDALVLPRSSEDEVYFLINRYLTPPVFGGSIVPEEDGGDAGTLVGLEERLVIPPAGTPTSAAVVAGLLYTYYKEGAILEYTGGIGAARLNDVYPAQSSSLTLVQMQFSESGDQLILPLNLATLTGTDTYYLPAPWSLRSARAKVDVGSSPFSNGLGIVQPGGSYFHRINAVSSVYEYALGTAWDVSTYGAPTSYTVSGSISGVAYRANYTFMNAARTVLNTVSNNKEAGTYFPMFNVSFSTPGDWSTRSVASMTQFITSYSGIVATQLSGGLYTMIGDTSDVLTVSQATGSIADIYTPDRIGSDVEGFKFSSSGAYLYLVGAGASKNSIVRATLATPFVVTEPTWGAVTVYVASARSMALNDDGTRIYVRTNGRLYQYDLTVAYDPAGGHVAAGDVVALANDYDITFNPTGTVMIWVSKTAATVNKATLSTAWNITTLGATTTTSVAAQTASPTGVCFSEDGAKMFVCCDDGFGLHEYSLSTAYDPTTKTYVGTNPSVKSGMGPRTTYRRGVQFSDTGNKMFMLGARFSGSVYASEIFQFAAIHSPSIDSLATETSTWDIFSAVQLYTEAQAHDETLGAGLFVKPDGLKLYYWSLGSGGVDEYTMTGAFDLDTAGAPANTAFATVTGQIFFDGGGTYMFAPVDTPSAGIGRFALASAWTLAAASQDEFLSKATIGAALAVSSDGLHFYYFDTTDDTIRHLETATAWEVSSATQTETFDPADPAFWAAPAPTAMWIHPDGTYLFVADPAVGVIQYTLASAYTLTGAVISSTSSTTFADPYALAFSDDGKYVYTVDSTIQQWGLLTEVALVPDGTVATGITIEKLSKFSESKGDSVSRHYDSHHYFDTATPGTTLTGLDNLEAENVYVWSEGKEYGPFEVVAGEIDTIIQYPYPVVGMRHDAAYLSNRLSDYVNANVMSEFKRVVNTGLVLSNAVLTAIRVGPDSTRMRGFPEIDYAFVDEDTAQTYDNRPWEFDGEFDVDSRIRIEATGPCLVKALTYYVDQPFDTPPDES